MRAASPGGWHRTIPTARNEKPMTSFPALVVGVAGATAIALLGACSHPAQQTSSTTAAAASAAQRVQPAGRHSRQPDIRYLHRGGRHLFGEVSGGLGAHHSGDSVVFADKFNSVTLSPHNGFYQPTEDFAKTVEKPQIAATTEGFKPGSVSTVKRSAGPAILITYQRQSAPSPVTGKAVTQDVQRYEFAKGGRGVVITLASPVGSDNVDPWRVVTDSFTWLT